jgi:hypothetical protein
MLPEEGDAARLLNTFVPGEKIEKSLLRRFGKRMRRRSRLNVKKYNPKVLNEIAEGLGCGTDVTVDEV